MIYRRLLKRMQARPRCSEAQKFHPKLVVGRTSWRPRRAAARWTSGLWPQRRLARPRRPGRVPAFAPGPGHRGAHHGKPTAVLREPRQGAPGPRPARRQARRRFRGLPSQAPRQRQDARPHGAGQRLAFPGVDAGAAAARRIPADAAHAVTDGRQPATDGLAVESRLPGGLTLRHRAVCRRLSRAAYAKIKKSTPGRYFRS